MKQTIALLLFFSVSLFAFSNELESEGAVLEAESTEASTEDVEQSDEADSSDVESVTDEWRRTLTYGIDSEVLELLPQLREDGRDEVAREVLDVMAISLNPEVRIEALRYFTELGIDDAEETVAEIIISAAETEQPAPLLQEALRYVESVANEPAPALVAGIRAIAEGRDQRTAAAAVRTLGNVGGDDDVEFLLSLYEDRGTSQEVKQAILLSLGDLGDRSAEQLLLSIAKDSAVPNTSRYYAIDSLSKIGSEDAVSLFQDLLGSNDAILRSYAIAALARYETDEVDETLVRALRDSFWRVRVSALAGIAERGHEAAMPAVKYKLERDPEMRVRYEAAKTIGAIGTKEAWDYLRELYVDETVPVTVRNSIAEQLIHGDLDGSLEALATVIEQEWERDGSVLLDYAAKELSTIEADGVGDLYATLLGHPNFIIQIYAIRGIGANGLARFEEDLAALADHESAHRAVRSNARASLDSLGAHRED